MAELRRRKKLTAEGPTLRHVAGGLRQLSRRLPSRFFYAHLVRKLPRVSGDGIDGVCGAVPPVMTEYHVQNSPHSRAMYGMPYRPGGLLVCPLQDLRPLSGLCNRYRHISTAHSSAGQKPAARTGNLRTVPLAGEIFGWVELRRQFFLPDKQTLRGT
jgi:hypothetical protein